MDGQALWEVGTLFKCGVFYYAATSNQPGAASAERILTLCVSPGACHVDAHPGRTTSSFSSLSFFSPVPLGEA